MRPVQHTALFVPDIFAANKEDISWRYRNPRRQISIMRYQNRTAIIKFEKKPLMTGGTAIVFQVPENRRLHSQPDFGGMVLLGFENLSLGNADGAAVASSHRRPTDRGAEIGLITRRTGITSVSRHRLLRRSHTTGQRQGKAGGDSCPHIESN